ncbi:glucans biosynthesis glucosyltransferase MdoH [Paracoccus sp. SCSIO 75233]|uniref:glucans biosynthesis glucosyltransferase MdoH n=1 Tax=Paracoccus sp. SCSIO 75233 TaxID=3017782 RepID=UPI0022F13370|nr:glucans biosynthesis glucosyltransferase MdoH [Paracoccus sp. SCSIO 75233]WBU54310.1 glucans biosynthesis glucosyltransferase MdoH [Paracoccus sp. SCSIO 75233]
MIRPEPQITPEPANAAPQPAMPPDAPLAMPEQDFRARALSGPARQAVAPEVWLARLIAFGGAVVIGALGAWQMWAAFGTNIQPMQYVLLCLFTITFTWIGFNFCSMLAGLLARQHETPAEDGTARIAIVMPIYHEDPVESLALLAALADEAAAAGLAQRAEIIVLSDSNDPDFFPAEALAVAKLRAACPLPVWYRRRTQNNGRKAGNIAQFIRRWGARYDQMIVLDADSVVSGEVLRQMSARMSADPALALIQTVPMLIHGQTIFARATQFANRVYGPPVARGVAAWSGDNGNFWGHNALIRVPAFAACCGLPELPGRAPWGGTILSHDFVEAALLRRAGWKLRLDWDLRASYEGSPPTLLDMAVRERRWAQGNLQHLRVMGARGFTAISRVHFAIGILGFLMSPIWLAMILTGLVLTANVILSSPVYFPSTYQLFPDWPTFDARRMVWLLAASAALLLLPKFIAIGRAWRRPLAAGAGGHGHIFLSAICEILLSALIAPVQMLIQTRQIGEILLGRSSGWESQVRKGFMPSWGVVIRRHWAHVVAGLAVTVTIAYLSPAQLVWLSPILAGLILAPLTSRWSASAVLGRWARAAGLLVTPEERNVPPVMAASVNQARHLRGKADPMTTLGRDATARAAYASMIPALPRRATAERLDEISAAAKIAAAENRSQALSFLDGAERRALLDNAELLDSWSDLPE